MTVETMTEYNNIHLHYNTIPPFLSLSSNILTFCFYWHLQNTNKSQTPFTTPPSTPKALKTTRHYFKQQKRAARALHLQNKNT